MNLKIKALWSPDLNPPSTGAPIDPRCFSIFAQVLIGEETDGGEVFGLSICSPNMIASAISPAGFIAQTLVLDEFEWAVIRSRLESVVAEVAPKDWDDAYCRFRPYLSPSDEP